MTERVPELTQDELALMTAFEARTGDTSTGVDPSFAGGALSAELDAELNEFVALSARIDAIKLAPVAASVRSAVLNAAVAQAQADAKPTGALAALFTWLMRPGPVLIGTTAVALIAAFVARPTLKEAPTAANSMVALEKRSPQGAVEERRADDQDRPDDRPAAALDSPAELPRESPAKPALGSEGRQDSRDNDLQNKEGALAVAPPSSDQRELAQQPEQQAKKAPKRRAPRRTFAAKPASLGPADGRVGNATQDKLLADSDEASDRGNGDFELAARASGSKRSQPRRQRADTRTASAKETTLELRKDSEQSNSADNVAKYDLNARAEKKSRFAEPPASANAVAADQEQKRAPVWDRGSVPKLARRVASSSRSSSSSPSSSSSSSLPQRPSTRLAKNTYYEGRDRPTPSAPASAAPKRPGEATGGNATAERETSKAQQAVSKAIAKVGSADAKGAAERGGGKSSAEVAQLVTAFHRAESDTQREVAARAVLVAAKRNGDAATVKWANSELKKLKASQLARARKAAKSKKVAKKGGAAASQTKKAAPDRPSKPTASGAPARAKARAESYDSTSRK